jgi:hypothetical protein
MQAGCRSAQVSTLTEHILKNYPVADTSSQGDFPCAPVGAICCDDGINYALPPETCPAGTNPIKTVGTGSAPPSTITTPPETSTQIVGTLTYFTYEITWYYWYYYFTYFAGATATTSIQITTITTVSVQASNTAAANALFKSLSATIALPTPTQTATSLSGAAPSSTTPASTKSAAPSKSTTPSLNSTTTVATTSTAATTSAVQFTGAGATLRAGPVAYWAELAMGAFFLAPGLLMVWL